MNRTTATCLGFLVLAACGKSLGTFDAKEYEGLDTIARGRRVYDKLNCSTCHSLDGEDCAGGSLRGLLGRRVALDDGTSLTRDRAYLKRSILDPEAQLVDGKSPLMSSYVETFRGRDQELTWLLDWLASLR